MINIFLEYKIKATTTLAAYFFSILMGQTQDCNELLNKSIHLINEKKDKNALNILKIIESSCKDYYKGDSSSLLKINCMFGTAYYNNKEITQSVLYTKKAITYIEYKRNLYSSNEISDLTSLGAICQKNYLYYEAEICYNKAIYISNLISGDSSQTGIIFSNLSELHRVQGEYKKAIESALLALRWIILSYGENSRQYSIALLNLGNAYFEYGDFEKAEKSYIKSIEILKNSVGEKDYGYTISLNNLSTFYLNLGLYEKAEEIILKLVKINSDNNNPNKNNLFNAFNSLLVLYTKMGQYAKANDYFEKCYEIIKYDTNSNYEKQITLTANLGFLNIALGDNYNAEKLFNNAILISDLLFGKNSHNSIPHKSNLSSIYFYTNRIDKGINLLSNVIKIYKDTKGESSKEYLDNLIQLGAFTDDAGLYKTADSCFAEALPNIMQYFKYNSTYLSFSQLQDFITNNIYIKDIIFSFLNRNKETIPDNYLNLSISIKYLLLNNQILLSRLIQESGDKLLIYKWNNYKSTLKKYNDSKHVYKSNKDYTYKLEVELDSMQKYFFDKVPEYSRYVSRNTASWKEIQLNLKKNEAAIDFINFRNYERRWTDTVLYAAFVILPNNIKPIYISLFREDQLSDLLKTAKAPFQVNSLYQINNSNKFNQSLYNLIWKPLDSLLSGVEKIFISPSGLLHRISFSAIQSEKGGRLIDRFTIEIVSNIRSIAERNSNNSSLNNHFIIFGDIDYDKEPLRTIKSKNEYTTTNTFNSTVRTWVNGKWNYLPGTKNEINCIEQILYRTKKKFITFTKQSASEENLKYLGTIHNLSPFLLHIATHGFSYAIPRQKPQDNFIMSRQLTSLFVTSEDPLTRSGLVMAGGNQFWTTGKGYADREDGILTAREVAEMNLKNCELAVLSACETGLGDIKGSEGVYGLQRAFKMAGVRYLILSLWKVPDKETAIFMESFYSKWISQKKDIHVAFRETQLEMSKKTTPYQWAAFTLVQ